MDAKELLAFQQAITKVGFSAQQTADALKDMWAFRTSYCAHCDVRVFHSKEGYRKHRGTWIWIHAGTDVPWCKPDKQHGPKSRTAFPVPSLLIINEVGVLV